MTDLESDGAIEPEPPDDPPVIQVHFLRDNWQFERFADGTVLIHNTGPHGEPNCQLHLGLEEWVSVVVSMLGKGENAEDYQTIRNLCLQRT